MSDDQEDLLEQYQTAFYLQMYRLGAMLGAFFGETLSLWVALGLAMALDRIIGPSFTMTVRGFPIPVFVMIQVVVAVEIFRGAATIYLQENPEFRGIKKE